MTEFLMAPKHVVAISSGLAAMPGIIFGAITADAILPLFSLAGGVAVAAVYIWNAPRDADQKRQMAFVVDQLQYANKRITDLERELGDECESHRLTRRRLAQCWDLCTKSGIIINTPDPDRVPPKAPPPSV